MEEIYHARIDITTKNRGLMNHLLQMTLDNLFAKAIHEDPEIGLGIVRNVQKRVVALPIKKPVGGE